MPPDLRSAAIYHVLFADTVAYTKHTLDVKAIVDEALLGAVAEIQKSDRPKVMVDNGDGFFMAFEGDPRTACRAALKLRDELAHRCSAKIRIGVHSGVAILRDDLKAGTNLTGPAVEIAQRVMALSSGDEVFVSNHLAEHLFEFEDWKGRLRRPRPLPLKGGGSLVVWELDDSNPAPNVLVVAEEAAPRDLKVQVMSQLTARESHVVEVGAPKDIEGVADIARCAPFFDLLLVVAQSDSFLRKCLFESGVPLGDEFGIGCASHGTEPKVWLPSPSPEAMASALSPYLGSERGSPKRPESGLYVERAADRQVQEAIDRGAGIILVRAP